MFRNCCRMSRKESLPTIRNSFSQLNKTHTWNPISFLFQTRLRVSTLPKRWGRICPISYWDLWPYKTRIELFHHWIHLLILANLQSLWVRDFSRSVPWEKSDLKRERFRGWPEEDNFNSDELPMVARVYNAQSVSSIYIHISKQGGNQYNVGDWPHISLSFDGWREGSGDRVD